MLIRFKFVSLYGGNTYLDTQKAKDVTAWQFTGMYTKLQANGTFHFFVFYASIEKKLNI